MPRPFAAHHADTIVVGGTSKSHWSGLRVDWYRASAQVRKRLADSNARAVAEVIGDVKLVLPRGGLSLWLELPDPISSAVALAAEPEGLMIASGPAFAATGRMDRFIRLPYVLDRADMTEAVARLARAIDKVRGGSIRAQYPGREQARTHVA